MVGSIFKVVESTITLPTRIGIGDLVASIDRDNRISSPIVVTDIKLGDRDCEICGIQIAGHGAGKSQCFFVNRTDLLYTTKVNINFTALIELLNYNKEQLSKDDKHA